MEMKQLIDELFINSYMYIFFDITKLLKKLNYVINLTRDDGTRITTQILLYMMPVIKIDNNKSIRLIIYKKKDFNYLLN